MGGNDQKCVCVCLCERVCVCTPASMCVCVQMFVVNFSLRYLSRESLCFPPTPSSFLGFLRREGRGGEERGGEERRRAKTEKKKGRKKGGMEG